MAVYNGERFLREQLESLLAQMHGGWRLLVRDDGSTDGTLSMLEALRAEHPEQIQFVRDNLGRLGATGNFLRLLELSAGPYIMFCDQDDVWLPDKINLSLAAMQQAEEETPNLPILVHTDLIVVDEALRQIEESFWRVRRILIDEQDPLNSLLYANGVTGCTMLMNRRAKEISLPFPDYVRLHDWWVALNVAKKGRLISLAKPTVLYRQHGANTIGAPTLKWAYLRNSSAKLGTFHRRIWRDYMMVKKIVPNLSFLPWCIRYVKSLTTNQAYRGNRFFRRKQKTRC